MYDIVRSKVFDLKEMHISREGISNELSICGIKESRSIFYEKL